MELRIFLSLLFTALAFLAVGSFAYYNPSIFGGNFKLVRTSKFLSIKPCKTTNGFVIENIKKIGMGIIITGFLSMGFAAAYLFYPEILLMFSYS